jgi:hypothetical protein
MNADIIIVSGLPRSGTSLMMQMLDNGGIEVVTDHLRAPDTDNPRGYFELEKVKRIKEDASWLPETRGKAFKMVSLLLYDLPPSERYRIIFMERDLEEMLVSQDKMLRRLNQPSAPREAVSRAFQMHLDKMRTWLAGQDHIVVLRMCYGDLLANPRVQVERLNAFLDGRLDLEGALGTIDPSLYRNRMPGNDPGADKVG